MVWNKSVTAEFNKWLASENGKRVLSTPLGNNDFTTVLANRMERSFEAGADAGQRILVQFLSQHYRDELESLIT